MEKKLILDYSTWRCGLVGDHKLGEGPTQLRNSEGFMCCIGQWSLQLDKSLTPEQITGFSAPDELSHAIPELSYGSADEFDAESILDSDFTSSCITINDNENTTPEAKIHQLRYQCEKIGYKLEVINKN